MGGCAFEAQLIFEDQVASLKSDSKKMGTQEATTIRAPGRWSPQREQGITIDRVPILLDRPAEVHRRRHTAYEYPGYADRGLHGRRRGDPDRRTPSPAQTRRHSMICSNSAKNIVLADNKMDLRDYSEETFNAIN